jgi:hypothetical protein
MKSRRSQLTVLTTAMLTMATLMTVIGSISVAAAPPGLAATLAPAGAQQAQAPDAPQVVLVNQPANSVCAGHTFTVGVWYQAISGGSRAYRVSIWGPRHRRFFYRQGTAPTSHWRFWKVRAGRRGRYRVVYSGHRPGSAKWSRYQVITHARRCARY